MKIRIGDQYSNGQLIVVLNQIKSTNAGYRLLLNPIAGNEEKRSIKDPFWLSAEVFQSIYWE